LYASKIAGLMIGTRGQPAAAILALEQERDAAMAEFMRTLEDDKCRALKAVGPRKRQRRLRIAALVPHAPDVRMFRSGLLYPKP
jgi:hypothetical protein